MVSYNNTCKRCGNTIRYWISLCNKCRDERNYNAANVSMAKKRLSNILKQKQITKEWLDKVDTQSSRIIKYWNEILTYK